MAKSSHLYLAAATACLTSALFGYSVGFISGVLVLPSFLHAFRLDVLGPAELAAAQSLAITTWLAGALFGVPLAMPVCSALGRKKCLILSALFNVAGCSAQFLSLGNLHLFYLGRLLSGLGVGAGTLAAPIYISEISPPSKRGLLMSGYGTALLLCALAGSWGAYLSTSWFPDTSALQWQVPISVQLIPGSFLMIGSMLIPESPAYLIGRGHIEATRNALVWLRQVPPNGILIQDELYTLAEEARASTAAESEHPGFLKAISTPDMQKRLALGVGIMVAQNMVGLNALNYYGPMIFSSAGFTSVSSQLLLTGIFGLVKVVAALVFMFVFVRIKGNRFWLKCGSAACGISMLVLAYCIRNLAANDQRDTSRPTRSGVISVLMVYSFAFFFGVSLGPISWNICSEIFPSRINAKCCAITTCVQWVFQIVVAFVTPRLIASVGWATYLLYGLFCFMTYAWVGFYVPETRGVPLGKAMDEIFAKSLEIKISETEAHERTSLLPESIYR